MRASSKAPSTAAAASSTATRFLSHVSPRPQRPRTTHREYPHPPSPPILHRRRFAVKTYRQLAMVHKRRGGHHPSRGAGGEPCSTLEPKLPPRGRHPDDLTRDALPLLHNTSEILGTPLPETHRPHGHMATLLRSPSSPTAPCAPWRAALWRCFVTAHEVAIDGRLVSIGPPVSPVQRPLTTQATTPAHWQAKLIYLSYLCRGRRRGKHRASDGIWHSRGQHLPAFVSSRTIHTMHGMDVPVYTMLSQL